MFEKLFLTLLLVTSFAQAQDGQDGNGGGGVLRNGRYMTFYSAGVTVEDSEKSLSAIPGLKETILHLQKNHLFAKDTLSTLISALMPSESRTYHDLKVDKFSKAVEKRLIAEYARIAQAPTKELTLFAVTDVNTRKTLLFPSFYRLKGIEQMAILLHEALWIATEEATYETVLSAEIAFQKYLEDPQNAGNAYQFVRKVGTPTDLLYFAIKKDTARNILNKEFNVIQFQQNKMVLNLGNLIGEEARECANVRGYFAHECIVAMRVHSLSLSEVFPHSFFIKYWSESLLENKISFAIHEYSKDGQYQYSSFKFDPIPFNQKTFQMEFKHSWDGFIETKNFVSLKKEYNDNFKISIRFGYN